MTRGTQNAQMQGAAPQAGPESSEFAWILAVEGDARPNGMAR